MLDENIKKRLIKKAKVGRRLNFTIAIVVIVTMAIFEYLSLIVMHKFGGNFSNYIEFHLMHAVITIAVLLIATYVIISKYVVKPVYQLLIAIEEMKTGKLVTALEVKSNDEFELLAEEFNEMGFQLRDLMQHKIRAGKYSAATLLATRMANSLFEPCSLLRTNVKLLKDITKGNSQLETLSDMILKDVLKIEEQLKEISSIEVPKELQ
ncbi:MAG: HAMP domain-containing protein [Deltaproteobacteria bacterium]|nr:HAMP domain-containing protein [Deltaproteobacteria bacterium]